MGKFDPDDAVQYLEFLDELGEDPMEVPVPGPVTPLLQYTRRLSSSTPVHPTSDFHVPVVQKAAAFVNTFNKIHTKKTKLMAASFTDLVDNKWSEREIETHIRHELEVKNLSTTRIACQMRKALDLNLTKGLA